MRTLGKSIAIFLLLSLYALASLGILAFPAGRARKRARLTCNASFFARLGLRVLGIRVDARRRTRKGDRPRQRNHLIIANHLSYIDILVINSLMPSAFITSVELMRTFPLGLFARFGGCLFVERRSPAGLKREIGEIEQVLSERTSIVLRDANGSLNVGTRDRATGKEQRVTITAPTNLSKSDIDRMVQDAREHESDDRNRRELIEVRNQADSLAYQTEKTLRELGDKVPAHERTNIEYKVQELRETIQRDDVNLIKRQTEELQNAFNALSQQLYAQQTQTGTNGNGHGPGGPSDEGEVVEGQFREAW